MSRNRRGYTHGSEGNSYPTSDRRQVHSATATVGINTRHKRYILNCATVIVVSEPSEGNQSRHTESIVCQDLELRKDLLYFAFSFLLTQVAE